MESNNGPVDYERTWSVIQLRYDIHDIHEAPLTPASILELAEECINEPRFITMCGNTVHGQKFLHELMDFIQTIAARASQERILLGEDDGYKYLGYQDNGRRFQLDKAPIFNTRPLRQLSVRIK